MKSVLIVDDNKSIRKHMHDLLEMLGFDNIDEVTNGLEALNYVRGAMPDIITLDWNMPLMDGPEFLKALRKLPGGNAPKVIFCSYESNGAKIEVVMRSGADAYIVKPVGAEILREKLSSLRA